ncbi:MAG: aminotransferase [Sphingomonadales bacterium]|nr:MAG: aminotransferase [Sphingomonadales bacterium]TNF03538.1 MAG: aminotransferase [Sphingomonadales bacterium]
MAMTPPATGRYDLIETIAFDPVDGMPLLDFHLARLKQSSVALGFAFDRHEARNELQAATFHLKRKARVRMLVSRGGALAIEVRDHRSWPQPIMELKAVTRSVAPDDWRLYHKTTDRRLYQDALERGGTYEVLLLDEAGYLTEGCFSTVFVERGDKLVTPPLSRGLLPGVLRESLIACGEAVEGEIRPYDLERGFFIGNASRGMVAARLIR